MADEARVRKVQDRIQETAASLLGRRIKDTPRFSTRFSEMKTTVPVPRAPSNQQRALFVARLVKPLAFGSLPAWSLSRMLYRKR